MYVLVQRDHFIVNLFKWSFCYQETLKQIINSTLLYVPKNLIAKIVLSTYIIARIKTIAIYHTISNFPSNALILNTCRALGGVTEVANIT